MVLTNLYKLFKSLDPKNLNIFYFFFIIAFLILILEFFSTTFLIGILLKLINNDTAIFNNNYLNQIELYFKNLSLFKLTLLTFFIFLFKNIFLLLFRFWQIKYSFEFQKNLSVSLLKNILISDLLVFQKDNSAFKFRNIYTEVGWVRKLMLQSADLLTETFVIFGIALLLIFYDPFLVMVSIIFFGFSIGIIYFAFYKKNKQWADERIKLSGNLILNIIQSLSSVKEIKIFKKIGATVDYFQSSYGKYIKNAVTHGLVKSASKPWVETFTILFIFLIVNYSIHIGIKQEELFSKLGVFFICIVRIMPSLLKIYNIIYTINFLQSSVNLIKDQLVDERRYLNEIKKENEKEKIIKINSNVEVVNISHVYPNAEKKVLDKINFKFVKGKINTIIGNSGSGKTTLLNIILGLIKPKNGLIKIDSRDFTDKKIYENLNVGYVPQNVFLFDDTIGNNISFMEKNENNLVQEKLIKTSKDAEILNFINSLPDGFDHIIGERGAKVSGGQMQRIGLARALYSDPEILILDEFTSSVDLYTEEKLMKTLNNIKKNKLIIIISHRQQTIDYSDNILDLTAR